MKTSSVISLLLFLFALNSFAQESKLPFQNSTQMILGPTGQRLRVTVNCVLRYSMTTSCDDFKNTFFQAHLNEITRVEANAKSDLEFTLTDEAIDATHVGYTYKWISHLAGTSSEPLVVPLLLPTAFDPLSTLTKLVQNASKGLYFYFSVASDSSNAGTTTVVYKLPEEGVVTDTGWLDKLAKSPFYFNISLIGSASSMGESQYRTVQRGFPESLEFGYFKDKYKIDLTGSYVSTYVSTPSGTGTNISATDTAKAFNGLEVYSFSKDWSVAVIETHSSDPAANTRSSDTIQTGVEWTLVPFRTTENHELAFRVGPSYTTTKLYAPNALDNLNETYLGAFSQIYFYWAGFGDRLIAATSATYNENLKYKDYSNFSMTGSLTYQFNSIFSITGSTSFTDTPHSITFPQNPDYTNSLQALFLSGQPGKTYVYRLGFNVQLGNSVRKARDRRWSTSSNSSSNSSSFSN